MDGLSFAGIAVWALQILVVVGGLVAIVVIGVRIGRR